MKLPIKLILNIIWQIIPKDYLAEVSLELLRRAAEKTDWKFDDELIESLSEIYYKMKDNKRRYEKP